MRNRDLSQWKLRFSQPDEKYAGAYFSDSGLLNGNCRDLTRTVG